MEELTTNMKVGTRRKNLPFQKGILMSIKSTRALYHHLQIKSLTYVLMTRVNQDHVENLFSRIRAFTGGYTHPSAVDCLRRLRILMLGQDFALHYEKPSVETERVTQDSANSRVSDVPNSLPEPPRDTEETGDSECLTKQLTADITDLSMQEEEDLLSDDALKAISQ